MKKLLIFINLIFSLLGIFLLAGGANLFYPPQTTPVATFPTPPAEVISVENQKSVFIEPDAGVAPVLDAINSANHSIDLTIYEISDPQIMGALSSAEKRGVVVRVIYNDSFMSSKTQQVNEQAISFLQESGIQARKSSSDFTFTHQKTFLIDNREAVIMSFNLQPSYFSTSRDFGVITTDPAEVAEIGMVFTADWNGQRASPNVSTLVWSPDNARLKILKLISNSQKTLDIYAEELQDDESMEALIQAARRGVAVRVISAQIWDNKKDANSNWRQILNNEGVRVVIGKPLYTHAKMILSDYGLKDQMAYLGSINFSATSMDYNRELGVLLLDKNNLDQLEQVFNKDWGS